MTNAPVTGKASVVMNMAKNAKNIQKGSSSDSFSQVLDKNKPTSQQDISETKYESVARTGTQVENSGKKVLKEQKPQSLETSEQDNVTEIPQEIPQEAVEEAAQKIVEAVAKQMGMTTEEVMNALQNLELTPMDLLSKDNLANLLIALNPGSDMMSMLTNETMYDAFTQLTKIVETTVEELKNTFSLTDEEFAALLAESKKAAGLEDGKLNGNDTKFQQIDSDKLLENDKAPIKEEFMAEKDKMAPIVTDKAAMTENAVKNNVGEDAQTAKVEVMDKVDSQGEKTQKEFTGQDTSDEKNAKEDGTSNQQPLFQTVANRSGQVQEMPAEAQNLKQTADTESIMKQIMDYMKIQVKADLTQMEIQLHPSSLGNINVQISSKEGVITAQFTAQNEGVKAALESQIVQLKENLSEQGLKVEAVEVTVASHQFERQMEQGQQDNSQTADTKKKGVRRINLDELGDLEEEPLGEADKITADMMEKNGNTVDYMV